MSSTRSGANYRADSPDPASHAPNVYDDPNWDENDDDIDYEPPTETESADLEFFDTAFGDDSDDDDEGSEFHDAEEGSPHELEIELSIDPSSGAAGNIGNIRITQAGDNAPLQVNRAQILQLLGNSGLRRILAQHGGGLLGVGAQDDDEDDDDDDPYDDSRFRMFGRSRRRPRRSQPEFPPVPSPEGQKLMKSGTFGSNASYQDVLRKRTQKMTKNLMIREIGQYGDQATRRNRLIAQGLLPSSIADTIIHYNARCYSGQFSNDGNFFFSCSQDFKVRMYDTSNPYDWKYYKSVHYPYPQWTITDASLSPDNKYLAYSSIRSQVCLAHTDPDVETEPQMLNFADMGHRHHGYTHFGIWSVRFSGDGRELVAGTSDSKVYVFDIERNHSIFSVQGHSDDVNAVCFGDTSSPHILYSGSDDSLIKVWDRRSMANKREAGLFIGHTEGLTYVDSKGDGRYVLSNGKDQSMKLWDLRKMMSSDKAQHINPQQYLSGFDYRFMPYSESDYTPHPYDCSVVTFRGHRVLKTLIRCHFSPPGSTDSRYVYSGSEDGKVYIYNMDATLAGKIDVQQASYNSRPRDPNIYDDLDERGSRDAWKTCVRDASWHPNAPMIAATSWNGWSGSTGTCTIHSWNDGLDDDESEIPMGRRVNQKLEMDPAFYNSPARPTQGRTGSIGSRLRSHFIRRANRD